MTRSPSAEPAAPALPHPQLFQALDELADRMPPDAHREDGEVHVPAGGVDRENFERAVRGVEETIAKSPQWPLLLAILSHLRPLADSLRSKPGQVVVDVTFGHRFRVLAWSAHEQEKGRRRNWKLPDASHDVLSALAKRPAKDRAAALQMLWTAAYPQYLDAARNLIDAVRVGRGADDVECWGFLAEQESGSVQAAAKRIAADIVMGRRGLPTTNQALADALAEEIEFLPQRRREAVKGHDRDFVLLVKSTIESTVVKQYPAYRTVWPLLRGCRIEAGPLVDALRVVVLHHHDIGLDVGPQPLPPHDAGALVPPAELFGGRAAISANKDKIATWFTTARTTLNVAPLDALFVYPLRAQPGDGTGVSAGWSLDDANGVTSQLRMNISHHAQAIGANGGPKDGAPPPTPRPSWERLRVSEEGGQAFVDGVPHRLVGAYDAEFLRKLIAAKGEPLKGTALATTLGERPDRIFPRLPLAVRRLIDKPKKGRTGWRLK